MQYFLEASVAMGARCPLRHTRETNRPSIRLRRPRSPSGSREGDWGRKVKGNGEGWGRKTRPSCSTGSDVRNRETRVQGQVAAPYRPPPRRREENRHQFAPRVRMTGIEEPESRVKSPHPTDRCRADPTNRPDKPTRHARGGGGEKTPTPPPQRRHGRGSGGSGGHGAEESGAGHCAGSGGGGDERGGARDGGANARTHRRDEDGLPNAPDGCRPRHGRAPRARRSRVCARGRKGGGRETGRGRRATGAGGVTAPPPTPRGYAGGGRGAESIGGGGRGGVNECQLTEMWIEIAAKSVTLRQLGYVLAYLARQIYYRNTLR